MLSVAVCWIAALVAAGPPRQRPSLRVPADLPAHLRQLRLRPPAQPACLAQAGEDQPGDPALRRRPGLLQGLPLGHTFTASLLWTAGILVVFAPLAVHTYRRQV